MWICVLPVIIFIINVTQASDFYFNLLRICSHQLTLSRVIDFVHIVCAKCYGKHTFSLPMLLCVLGFERVTITLYAWLSEKFYLFLLYCLCWWWTFYNHDGFSIELSFSKFLIPWTANVTRIDGTHIRMITNWSWSQLKMLKMVHYQFTWYYDALLLLCLLYIRNCPS